MKPRHLWKSIAIGLPLLFAAGRSEAAVDDAELRREFADPPLRWQSRPLWFWNGKLDAGKTKAMVAACKAAGYYGMGILPCNGMGVDFMSPEFLKHYKVAVDEAGRLGMKMCLYDEFWFPSGSAGGRLAEKHPEALGKRLDMLAADVRGPKEFTQAVPEGTLMGAVAMETATKQRIDITASIKDGTLRWNVPAGEWKVMIFTCVRDGGDGLVDYLEPKAVDAFIKLTYQAYHEAMPNQFGTTIDGAFYDEPAFYHVKGGRAWTDRFNERFIERFKTHPITLYPALWFDIGPDTAAARNALFGMRAELYATGFVKTISDWCATHRMDLTGHADQEEVVNPVIGTVGDLIKSFKYQSVPGIDQIGAYGRASRAYKVVSSAANNYDRPQVVTECYGAMDLPLPNLYKEAMDQFAKGINVMVPHAVWYDPATIVFQPDLSPGAPKYGPALPAYNQYIGRLQRMLQGGRHVADIGVLYPIATLQAGSWFGPGNPYAGCVDIPEADYMQVGEALSLGVRRDFTFVHPEVLEERCAVDGAAITLNNKVNHERWRAFIIPGSSCINVATLRFIKSFYNRGGTVIATTRLPDRGAEFGTDAEVRQWVVEIFGPDLPRQDAAPRVSASSTWAGYEPVKTMDGNTETRWNAADGDKGAQWLEADLGNTQTVAGVVVNEVFDRVRGYRIQTWDGTAWIDQAKGDRLGERKEITFASVATTKVRLFMEAVVSDSASLAEWTILGAGGRNLFEREPSACRRNARGGKAWFLPSPSVAALKAVLNEALPEGDVVIGQDLTVSGGNVSYIHKVRDGKSIYFFANSSNAEVDTWVNLRGNLTPEIWNPHDGKIGPAEVEHVVGKEGPVTRVHVRLAPVRSLFLVAADTGNTRGETLRLQAGLQPSLSGTEPIRAVSDPSQLTVDRIFGQEEEFKAEDWGPAYWLKDSSAYTTLQVAERFKDSDAGKDAKTIKDIVWYTPESGQRDIIVAAESLIPPGQPTPLPIEDYAWSDDATKVLLFTNTKRVWRKETRGDYWVFDRRTRGLKQLGGEAPPTTLMFATFSPDGMRVAYVRENNLFVQSLDNLRIKQLTTDGSATIINGTADWVNEEEFGLRNGLRWSPDGKFIAYWQFDTTGVREFTLINNTDTLYPQITAFAYPKAGETNSACRVGVVNASGGRTRWFRPNADPRNHYIPRMEWAKDSRHVLFQQLNRLQNTNQVIAGDPRTGATQVRFTDRDDAWVEVMNEMHWIEDGRRFLWLSERDGWQHLYAVSVADPEIRLLTPGDFDVISIAGVDEQQGCVYFLASPDNPTQRYLYRASINGAGAAVRVSPPDQPGTHAYELSKDGRWAFHTYSRFSQPPVIELVQLPDHKVIRSLAGNAELREKVTGLKPCASEFFRVHLSNGPPLDAWCIKPPDFDPARRYPLLLHVYGEPAGSTVLDTWGGDTYLWHCLLAQRGYIVISIDNRGTATPRGRDWRKSIYRQLGILASADQAAATREILRQRPYLDPAQVGIWGWSGGGSMSLNAIFRFPDLYQTAMAIAFVANQRFYDTIYQERYMGLPADNEAGFENGSPITFAHQLKGNLLLVYGTADDNCHYQNCEVLVNALIKENKQFDQMPYPNRTHAIREGDNTKRHLFETLTRYLGENLPVKP